MWIYWFIGLLVIIKCENASSQSSQSESSRKQHYVRNEEQPKQEIPAEYLSFLKELSHYQTAQAQTISQGVPQGLPQETKNPQQHTATIYQRVPQKTKQQHTATLSQAAPQKTKNHQQHAATLSQSASQKHKSHQQPQQVAKIQYEYEPKPDKEIRYVTEKEYAQLIENEQASKASLKKQQQIHQQNRFKLQQTRFNENLRQRDQIEQDLLLATKQVSSPFEGSTFEKELKRLESLNRPVKTHDFNSNTAQQSAYNTRQDEVYQDDNDDDTQQPSNESVKTTKPQNENKRNAGKPHVHHETDNTRLPFLDKDRVFTQSEFQAFLDAGYPVVAVPVVQEASSRPNY